MSVADLHGVFDANNDNRWYSLLDIHPASGFDRRGDALHGNAANSILEDGEMAKALILSIAWVVGWSALALGGELSRHARQDMALQRALELCGDRQPTWSMTEPFRLETAPRGYVVRGNELLVVCEVQPREWVVSWTPPTQRADGAALHPADIAGYEVLIDGAVVGMTTATQWRTAPMLSVEAMVVRTVDTDGQRSVAARVM